MWLLYVGLLSYSGAVSNTALRPPGIVYVAFSAVLFVLLVFALSGAGARIASAFPFWVIIGMQTFRIGVELLLHRLWVDGLAPRMVTYQGRKHRHLDWLVSAIDCLDIHPRAPGENGWRSAGTSWACLRWPTPLHSLR